MDTVLCSDSLLFIVGQSYFEKASRKFCAALLIASIHNVSIQYEKKKND